MLERDVGGDEAQARLDPHQFASHLERRRGPITSVLLQTSQQDFGKLGGDVRVLESRCGLAQDAQDCPGDRLTRLAGERSSTVQQGVEGRRQLVHVGGATDRPALEDLRRRVHRRERS